MNDLRAGLGLPGSKPMNFAARNEGRPADDERLHRTPHNHRIDLASRDPQAGRCIADSAYEHRFVACGIHRSSRLLRERGLGWRRRVIPNGFAELSLDDLASMPNLLSLT
jgi:hypothetical protein